MPGPRRLLQTIKDLFSSGSSLETAFLPEVYPTTRKHLLVESQEVPTPEAKDMSFNDFHSYLDASTYRSLPVYTTLLDDVLFCPVNNVLMTSDRTVINETAGPGAKPFYVDQEAILRTDQVESLPGVCTGLRCSFDNYYHFLIDHLSRFDLLNEPFFSQYEEIKLLCPGGLRPTEEYFISRLCPSNVTVVPLDDNVLYRPEKYLFLSFLTRRSSAYIPGPFVERLRARVLYENAGARTRRLYISRRKATDRHLRNEDALMRRLRPLGFRRVLLEELSPSDQIRLFQETEMVVAPHGAGLANLLFATDATVLELQPSSTIAPHYYLLCKRMGHEYQYLTHDAPAIDDDFSTRPSAVVEELPLPKRNAPSA